MVLGENAASTKTTHTKTPRTKTPHYINAANAADYIYAAYRNVANFIKCTKTPHFSFFHTQPP